MFSRYRHSAPAPAQRTEGEAGRHRPRHGAVLRYGLVLGVALLADALLFRFDASGALYRFGQRHAAPWLGDLSVAIAVIGAAALGVALLRMREIRARDRRRASAERVVAETMDAVDQGVSVFDAGRRLVACNAAFARIYGLPPERLRPGTPLAAILDESRVQAPSEPSRDAGLDELLGADGAEGARSIVRELPDGRCVRMTAKAREAGGWVLTHDDITGPRRLEERLTYLAHHDAPTGLANRHLLRERLETALAGLASGRALAIICLDLDHFKTINDTLGHALGDHLLRETAARLQSCAAEADVVARTGGDEFMVLQLGAAQPSGANSLAARILEAVAKPHDLAGQRIASHASIGIAMAPHHGADPDGLLKRADLALQRAKADGRGVCRVFETGMERRAREHRHLEVDLREASRTGQFELHYQPLLDLASNQVRGLEALIRWNHPTRGRISPGEFIPLAEETGLIPVIGEWVLRQACAQAAELPDDICIAVNVSAIQFRMPGLVKIVFSALTAAGLPASRLELEITESIMLEDSDTTLATLHQLRALGVRIAMDDFGTGYSSLSYFRSFPFDKIKIDRSFVQGLAEGKSSLAILRAIASLADNLGIITTAEGVETEEQLAKIRKEGITQAQGFLISPPRPAAELQHLIRRPAASRKVG
jgi:diguanylate cyclase (GGDEF)-like protein